MSDRSSRGRGSHEYAPYTESPLRQDPASVPKGPGPDAGRDASLLVQLAIWDEITRHAAHARLSTYERATLDAVLHETVRYGRVWQSVAKSLAQLDRYAEIGRQNVSPALKKLQQLNFITYRPGSPKKSAKGHSQTKSVIRIIVPMGWEEGTGLADRDDVVLVNVAGEGCSDNQNTQRSDNQHAECSDSQNAGCSGCHDTECPDNRDPYGEVPYGESSHEESSYGERADPLRGASRAVAEPPAQDESQAGCDATYEEQLSSWQRRLDDALSLDLIVQALQQEGPAWNDVQGFDGLLEAVMSTLPAGSPLAKTLTASRRRELREGYLLAAGEYEGITLPHLAWLMGHWLGYKRGEHAHFSEEHFHRAFHKLPELPDFPPFHLVGNGYLTGASARYEKEFPPPLKPWLGS